MDAGGLSHIVLSDATGRRLITRTGFVRELELQTLILASPELLEPLGTDLRFVPIGWEVPFGTIGLSLDLLFVDSEGLLTLVETKLKANDESRRRVVGQVLEYAMYASEWTVETVQTSAGEFLNSDHAPPDIRGRTFEEALAIRLGWGSGEAEVSVEYEALLAKIGYALKRGRLRVVIGVDEQVEQLERLIRYFSLHSDLQAVLLQVNRFPVDADTSVLIPTLQGDVEDEPRTPAGPTSRLNRTSLLEAFSEGPERAAVDSLLQTAAALGATFEYGPSGVSVRIQTKQVSSPITVAWIFAPGRVGWQRTREITFGHGQDSPTVPIQLRTVLGEYYEGLVTNGIGADACSKGVQARWMTATEAASRLEDLQARLQSVAARLMSLPPAEPTGI